MSRYSVFTIVFLLCCLRDWTNGETKIVDLIQSAYFIIAYRIIPSIKKKMEGNPVTFSLIKGLKEVSCFKRSQRSANVVHVSYCLSVTLSCKEILKSSQSDLKSSYISQQNFPSFTSKQHLLAFGEKALVLVVLVCSILDHFWGQF